MLENNKKYCSGFTLTELSIVIVVIALIVSSVVAAQSIIHTTKIRSVISDFRKYDVAYGAFYLKYNALPGDMSNASSHWSGATDGNGNKVISGSDSSHSESLNSWDHLSRAGLLKETYRSTGGVSIGVSHPTTEYSDIASFWPRTSGGINGVNYQGRGGQKMAFTGVGWYGWIDYKVAVIDAANLDKKIDDGKADLGTFSCWNINFGGVNPPACATNNEYNLTFTTNCTCDKDISTISSR